MGYESSPKPLLTAGKKGSEKENQLYGASGVQLCSNDFSLDRKVSHPGKTTYSAQVHSFSRKLVP